MLAATRGSRRAARVAGTGPEPAGSAAAGGAGKGHQTPLGEGVPWPVHHSAVRTTRSLINGTRVLFISEKDCQFQTNIRVENTFFFLSMKDTKPRAHSHIHMRFHCYKTGLTCYPWTNLVELVLLGQGEVLEEEVTFHVVVGVRPHGEVCAGDGHATQAVLQTLGTEVWPVWWWQECWPSVVVVGRDTTCVMMTGMLLYLWKLHTFVLLM